MLININNDKFKDDINVPELTYYKNQTIQVLIPQKKCYATLYFSPEYRKRNISKIIKKINLKDRNYFISFYENDPVYEQHIKILEKHSLIRSYYKYGKNNLFISSINWNPSINKKSNIYDLSKYQKVFQFLNSYHLFSKDNLYKSYTSMKKLFFDDFNYMPETYNYPEDKNTIYQKFKNYTLDLNNLWLVKPPNKFGGKNIIVLESLKKIKLKEFIITKYITDINLIKGKKYDLRLYILVTGLRPLRIYFYKEGLVRIATEKFFLNKNSIKNRYMHFTNVFINHLNKNYKIPKTTNDENSNLWNLFMYKSFLKQNNIEWKNISEKINDIIIKSIISVYKNLTEKNEKSNVKDQSFYQILGYDILINDVFNPILLEINMFPCMLFSNNIDKIIKSNLFVDTLNLIGIIPFSRKKEESLNPKFKYMNDLDDNINNALCELERPRGEFELIFPTKETINEYKKFFINNTEENKKFWDKILSINF